MGGFTTYSTFNLDVWMALQSGDTWRAGVTLLGTVFGCLLGAALGWALVDPSSDHDCPPQRRSHVVVARGMQRRVSDRRCHVLTAPAEMHKCALALKHRSVGLDRGVVLDVTLQ